MRRPSEADQELAELADVGGLVRFRLASGAAQVPVAGRQVFASFYKQGVEGIVIGFSFWTPSQDYVTNPVSVGTVGADQLADSIANATPQTAAIDPIDVLTCAVGQRGQPLIFPGGRRGYPFSSKRSPCLSVQNGSGAVLPIEGYLQLLVWDPKDRAEAFARVQAWRESGAFGGGERLFAK